MLKEIRPAVASFAVLTLLTGVAYPYAVTGLAQALMPARANGSLIVQDGRVVGSSLIGQPFSDPKHFWGRPSATAPTPYNAAASSGSNQGPTNPALIAAVAGAGPGPARGRPRQRGPGPGGPGHRLRQRARPAHQPGGGRLPGRPGRPGPGS